MPPGFATIGCFINAISLCDASPELHFTHAYINYIRIGFGNGHSSNKMGWILAGNTGPARNGYHLDCAPGKGFYETSDYNTNQLLVSIIQMFCLTNSDGSPINQFGLDGFSTGNIAPLFA